MLKILAFAPFNDMEIKIQKHRISAGLWNLPFCMLCFTEPLEVDDFALAQKLNRVPDVRVVGKTEDVVIYRAGLLLCCNPVRTA
jgi:hypothetical protein